MTKRELIDLAIFGGMPLFQEPRPVGQLHRPRKSDFLRQLESLFKRRRLTNCGPLQQELEERLAALHETRHCIAVVNAGVGIMMLMQISCQGRGGDIVMPVLTYRGLPYYARWAGMEPSYCDLDAETLTLDLAGVERSVGVGTRAILNVAAFNFPGHMDALQEIADRHGLPLLHDSVEGLYCTWHGRPLGHFGRAEVFSLHATKLLNGFEGGYITTDNDELARQLRVQRNFLFEADSGDGNGILGLNAKLNEIHAAMALLSLADLPTIVGENRERIATYRRSLNGIAGLRLLPYGEVERHNFQAAVVEVEPEWELGRDATLSILRAEGIAAVPYYGALLCRSVPGVGSGERTFPVAERLAASHIRMPAGSMVSPADVEMIGDLLTFLQQNAVPIQARLAA